MDVYCKRDAGWMQSSEQKYIIKIGLTLKKNYQICFKSVL